MVNRCGRAAFIGDRTLTLHASPEVPTPSDIPPPPPGGAAWFWQGGGMISGHKIEGAIYAKWVSLGSERSPLGDPLTDELITPYSASGLLHYQEFEGGYIILAPGNPAREIHGPICDKWISLGEGFGERQGYLEYPMTDVQTTPDGKGLYSEFQGGYIYWTPQTGAHAISGHSFAIGHNYQTGGTIYDAWMHNEQVSLEAGKGSLGYPVTDTQTTPDGKGWYNHFQGGSIYLSRDYGAYAVRGPIRDKWASLGSERSPLGYPASSEQLLQNSPDLQNYFGVRSGEGVYQLFQYGFIYWTPQTGANFKIGFPPTPTPPPIPTPPPTPPPPPPPPPTSQAVLVVSSTWTEPASPTEGQPFTVYSTFCNTGNKASDQFSIRFELDGGTSSVTIPYTQGLQPNECEKAWWPINNGLPAGNHYFYVYLDPGGTNVGYVGIIVGS